jgi:hypothetical protein
MIKKENKKYLCCVKIRNKKKEKKNIYLFVVHSFHLKIKQQQQREAN